MGIARKFQKRHACEEQWREEMRQAAARRLIMMPPKPGSLKPGDICPCGCGGVMQFVDGVLTAVTLDVIGGEGGDRTRIVGV